MNRFLFRLAKRILIYLYKENLALHYAGELGDLATIEYFGEGKVLAAVIVTPHGEGGYTLGYYTEEELDRSYYETD